MKRVSLVSASAVAALVAGVSFLSVGRSLAPRPAAPTANGEGAKMLGRVPAAFVPNLGQWDHAARYVARVGAMTVFLEERGWTFTLVERTAGKEDRVGRRRERKATHETAPVRGVAVRMTFAGASKPVLVAEVRLPGRHSYFLGNDAARWRSDVPLYASVRYREVQPGVDVRAREHDGHFEYDLLLQPEADLDPVEIAVEGIERMRVDGDALVLETRLGPVRMPAPLSWEEGPSGQKSEITCRYVLRANNCVGFEVTDRRPGWALVVDPGLVWSTYLGGAQNDYPSAVAVDAQGATTVAGYTRSANFPTTPGAFDASFNFGVFPADDAFVTRLSPTGSSLVYSTFLGGTSGDGANALALDAQGAATVTGWTSSADFPTTLGAFATSINGFGDAFVTRLSPTGSSLVYSTYLGGTADEEAHALALDAQGAATVAGWTNSADFPTTPGAFDTSFNGGGYPTDAFVAQISPTGSSLVYSTFLGGGMGDEYPSALALDAQGAATVLGNTTSPDFPTTPGAFDASFNGGQFPSDVFVTRLSPSGTSLVYSTYLGGTGEDSANAVALDIQGAATIVGYTYSTDFPTTPGAFDTTFGGGAFPPSDAFVTRLSPTGSSLVYSTYLGGIGGEEAFAVAVDAQGAATVAGHTNWTDFPTTPGAFDTSFNSSWGLRDAFVTRLSPTGSSLVYSTHLGGTSDDYATALALDAHGAATIAGVTFAPDFPTTPGAFDTSYNGTQTAFDVFVTRLDMLPRGVAAFGRSSAGCAGPLAISVNSMPRVGNAGFALTCGNAPPNTSGLLALTGHRFANPVVLLGVEIWVDPTLFIPIPANSNTVGASEVRLPIPSVPTLVGTRIFAQFFWAGPTSPPPCPPQGLSASNALEFTVQP